METNDKSKKQVTGTCWSRKKECGIVKGEKGGTEREPRLKDKRLEGKREGEQAELGLAGGGG